MRNETVDVIVNWWADKLRACKQSGLSETERNDPENRGYQMAELLMMMNKPRVTDEQVDKFKGALSAALQMKDVRYLDVDYGPDGLLADCLEAAGIPAETGVLPIKTTMWIDGDKVSVRCGYGAREQTLTAYGRMSRIRILAEAALRERPK